MVVTQTIYDRVITQKHMKACDTIVIHKGAFTCYVYQLELDVVVVGYIIKDENIILW